MSGRQFRELLQVDRPRIGTWVSIPAPYLLEILGSVGFDWLCIDMQHGLIGDDLLPSMLMAAAVSGTPALVRTRWNEPAAIMRSLDAGAAGVIVPLVNDRDEALSAARACRYPPNGFRSWGPMRPLEDGAPGASSDDGALCIVMVETQQAAAGAAAIVSAPGVDGVFVGPSDLSLSVAGRLGADISAADDSRRRGVRRGRDRRRHRLRRIGVRDRGPRGGLPFADPAMGRRHGR